jgi:hypothetical protein
MNFKVQSCKILTHIMTGDCTECCSIKIIRRHGSTLCHWWQRKLIHQANKECFLASPFNVDFGTFTLGPWVQRKKCRNCTWFQHAIRWPRVALECIRFVTLRSGNIGEGASRSVESQEAGKKAGRHERLWIIILVAGLVSFCFYPHRDVTRHQITLLQLAQTYFKVD